MVCNLFRSLTEWILFTSDCGLESFHIFGYNSRADFTMDLVLDEVLSIDDFPSICVACLALARRGRSQFHLINLEYLQELLGGEVSY